MLQKLQDTDVTQQAQAGSSEEGMDVDQSAVKIEPGNPAFS